MKLNAVPRFVSENWILYFSSSVIVLYILTHFGIENAILKFFKDNIHRDNYFKIMRVEFCQLSTMNYLFMTFLNIFMRVLR